MNIPSRHEILTGEVRSEIMSLRKAQLNSTNRIIASQGQITEKLSNIEGQLADVNNNIIEMTAMLGFHLSNITWLLEQQNELLQEILKVLLAPLGTMALELRNRAIEAFQNRWYTEALADFNKSVETNPYDFIAHHFLGLCYVESRAYADALAHFNLAVKYATPKSPLHASYSQLFIAHVHRQNSSYTEAKLATEAAVRLAPQYPEAHYQHGVSLALLNDSTGALSHIKQSISFEPEYVLRTRVDENLAHIMPEVAKLEEELYHEAKQQSDTCLKDARKVVALLPDSGSLLHGYKEAEELVNRDSFLDFIAADKRIGNLVTEAEQTLEYKLANLKEESVTGKRLHSLGELLLNVSYIGFVIGMIALILPGTWLIIVAVTGGDTSGTLSFMGRWGVRPIFWAIVLVGIVALLFFFGRRANKAKYKQSRSIFESSIETVRQIKNTRFGKA